jgi:predicted O-methyltransferase YrrM
MLTDKTISGLEDVYKCLLSPYKDKDITMLEIGVWNGGSMLMYEKMLPKAKIYGIDILERPECLAKSKVITRVMRQENNLALGMLALEAGGFDVIIDDGCHFTAETKSAFDTLWQHLKPGGIYIIEDWVVGIKNEGSENITYAEATRNMGELVLEIARNHKKLGIKSFKIIAEESWLSYAVFKKYE